MKPRAVLLGFAFAAIVAAPVSHAAVFKWANDGDARAMDPYTFNETVQNSFLANIYERLVQHNRKLELEPGLAVTGKTPAQCLALQVAARRQMAGRQGVHRRRRGLLLPADHGKNSAMRSQVATVKEARRIDDLTVEFETNGPDPICRPN